MTQYVIVLVGRKVPPVFEVCGDNHVLGMDLIEDGAQGRSLPHILCSATPVHPCTMESNPDWRFAAEKQDDVHPIRSAEYISLVRLASGDPPVGVILVGWNPTKMVPRGGIEPPTRGFSKYGHSAIDWKAELKYS